MIQATYTDKSDECYKVEQFYKDVNGYTYKIYHIDGIYRIVGKIIYSGDTTIIEESSHQINFPKYKNDDCLECNDWRIIFNGKDCDTIWFKCAENSDVNTKMNVKCDTFFVGKNYSAWYDDLQNQIKKKRFLRILDVISKNEKDSLIHLETIKSFYINSIPVRVEVSDRNNKLSYLVTSKRFKNRIVYCGSHPKEYFDHLNIDTVSWSDDTLLVKWSSTCCEEQKTIGTIYKFKNSQIEQIDDSGFVQITTFLENKNFFQNLLANNIIYSDNAIRCELRLAQRENFVSFTNNWLKIKNDFKVDDLNRIIEKVQFDKNDIISGRVKYQYY